MNNLKCDFCGKQSLELSYTPPTTERDLKIYTCKTCGLVQSWPRLSGVYERVVNVTGEAGWGRIRYGKRLTLGKSSKLIKKYIDFEKIDRILDIGANRFYFLHSIIQEYPNVNATGIENDIVLMDEEKIDNSIEVIGKKYEDVSIDANSFDLIHCSHTMEHVTCPKHLIEKVIEWLKPGGHIYFEVPKLEMIVEPDTITEFFIDNHLFHFSKKSFLKYFKNNFEILEFVEDLNSIAFVAKLVKKDNFKKNAELNFENEFDYAYKLIEDYKQIRSENLKKIENISKKINEMINSENIVFWGGARIFDIYYKYGDINWNQSCGLIDKYVSDYVQDVNGIRVHKPNELIDKKINTVIVFSDEYFNEIKNEALATFKDIKILKHSALI